MGSDAPLNVTVTLQQQTVFYKSKLFAAFLQERLSARLSRARTNHSVAEAVRLKEVKFLLEDENLGDDRKAELTCMSTLFGPAEQSAKVAFLLEKDEWFKVLAAWQPSRPLLRFQDLLLKTLPKDYSHEKLLEISLLVSADKNLLNMIANSVVKQVLTLLRKMKQVVAGIPEEERGPALALVKKAFLEISEVKLDVTQGYQPEMNLQALALPEASIKQHASLWHVKDLSHNGIALAIWQKCAEQKPEKKSGGAKASGKAAAKSAS